MANVYPYIICQPPVQRRSGVRLNVQAIMKNTGEGNTPTDPGIHRIGAGGANGSLAQLAEHRTLNPQVAGSIPA